MTKLEELEKKKLKAERKSHKLWGENLKLEREITDIRYGYDKLVKEIEQLKEDLAKSNNPEIVETCKALKSVNAQLERGNKQLQDKNAQLKESLRKLRVVESENSTLTQRISDYKDITPKIIDLMLEKKEQDIKDRDKCSQCYYCFTPDYQEVE